MEKKEDLAGESPVRKLFSFLSSCHHSSTQYAEGFSLLRGDCCSFSGQSLRIECDDG